MKQKKQTNSIATTKYPKRLEKGQKMGWPLSLAGWAHVASGPNEAGPKSLVPKWAKKIRPNPT
uniref:Uncharacterized protein n=1 Tax=Solanum tuberosum TaxID=4113 RepID=M0ZYI2_SOLTU